MANFIYKEDLPNDLDLGNTIAVDTETMGLNPERDRLCLIQLSNGNGDCHLVQLGKNSKFNSPNLNKLLSNKQVLKIFHFARFDVAIIQKYLRVSCQPIYCTKIASKLVRTYTDRHGYKDLCKDLLNIEISKQQQSSDWGSEKLSNQQIEYASTDVLHLHSLKEILDTMLMREGRVELANECFSFIPYRCKLDLNGWAEPDIFSH
ncbi:MAG: ribonuclease D [Rhodospirillaceae bacterium]|nr:ribonuclease D [Alphaproteobacteria bacterium]MBR72022.1 ribonuclease D [Rhodospirillaceae bacterium]|tara:strand:- start:4375 stop:4989 length:615 start_codon:yes stop_codon:yes gene_type:complete